MAKNFTIFEVGKIYTGEKGFMTIEDTKPFLVTARNYRKTKNGIHSYVSLVALNKRTMKPLGNAVSYLIDYLGNDVEAVFDVNGYDVLSDQEYKGKQ